MGSLKFANVESRNKLKFSAMGIWPPLKPQDGQGDIHVEAHFPRSQTCEAFISNSSDFFTTNALFHASEAIRI